MSETGSEDDESALGHDDFVVTPAGDGREEPAPIIGGTAVPEEERRRMLRRHVANPDDPVVELPPRRAGGLPGQEFYSAPGRLAIVQGQIYLVGVILVFQLWLITTALLELLSGNTVVLWPIFIASFIGFLIALIIFFWPRRRASGT